MALSKMFLALLQLITFVSEQRSKYTVYPSGELLISTNHGCLATKTWHFEISMHANMATDSGLCALDILPSCKPLAMTII